MKEARRQRVVIVGISSFLGRAVAESLAGREGLHVSGVYRSWRPELESLAAHFAAGSASTLTLEQADVTDPGARRRFLDGLSSHGEDDLVLLYCSGQWNSGRVAGLNDETIESVMAVGLIAPIAVTSQLLAVRSGARGATRIIIVTGLGGEKSGVRYNALYSAVTSGVYSFIRAVGMELAGTQDSCFGVALGLLDKGQPYIHELCSRLVTRRPTPLSEIVEFLTEHMRCEGTALNGSVVELSGGMFNYQEVARLLTEGLGE